MAVHWQLARSMEATSIVGWCVKDGRSHSRAMRTHTTRMRRVHVKPRAGLWSGAFIAPWDWRGRRKNTVVLGAASVSADAQPMLLAEASTLDAPVPECVIKGNRTSQGECIYHVPDGRYYSAVKMDLSTGK